MSPRNGTSACRQEGILGYLATSLKIGPERMARFETDDRGNFLHAFFLDLARKGKIAPTKFHCTRRFLFQVTQRREKT